LAFVCRPPDLRSPGQRRAARTSATHQPPPPVGPPKLTGAILEQVDTVVPVPVEPMGVPPVGSASIPAKSKARLARKPNWPTSAVPIVYVRVIPSSVGHDCPFDNWALEPISVNPSAQLTPASDCAVAMS